MRKLSHIAWGLTLAVCISGGLLVLLRIRAPGYFTLIQLHMILGGLLVLAGPAALGWHLIKTGSKAAGTVSCILVGCLLAIPVPGIMRIPEELHDFGPVGLLRHALSTVLDGDMTLLGPLLAFASLAILLGGASAYTLWGLVSRVRERSASRRTGLGLTLVFSWALVSGVLLLTTDVSLRRPSQMFHFFAGSWAIALLAIHLVARWAARSRVPRPVLFAIGMIGLVFFSYGLARWNKIEGKARATIELRTPVDPGERQALLVDEGGWKTVPVDHLSGDKTCASAGCHETAWRQWAGSPHRFSSANAFYKAAVDALIERQGLEAAIGCANCHDPVRVLTGTVAKDYENGVPEEGEGVSCIICHVITEPQTEPAANGQFHVEVEPPYPGGPEHMARNIWLDTKHHQNSFVANDAIYFNTPCLPCHRIEIGDHVIQQADMDRANEDSGNYCRHCHLRPAEGLTYSHFMAGIDADLEHYATGVRPEEQELIQRQAERVRRFAGLTAFEPIEGESWTEGKDGRGRGLSIGELRVEGRVEGSQLRLEVHTRRGLEGMNSEGHSFPSGPFDLNEVWLELRVVDAAGAVLHHSGLLDSEDRPEAGAARLGARELLADGTPVPEHRILEIARIEDKRQLGPVDPQSQLVDPFSIALPEEVAYPLDVRARWLFRRANTEFATWSLGTETNPLPIHELIGLRAAIDSGG